MAKFDKDGNRRVCEIHKDCIIPGQTIALVPKIKCYNCLQVHNRRSNGKKRQVKLIARAAKAKFEYANMKNVSVKRKKEK